MLPVTVGTTNRHVTMDRADSYRHSQASSKYLPYTGTGEPSWYACDIGTAAPPAGDDTWKKSRNLK